MAFLFTCATLGAQNLQDFEKKVTEFTLGNGLHFIVLQRPNAPVVSMVTLVNVGAANDQAGRTGLAHMLEHMAFKGTDTLGTKNWPEESKTLAQIEAIYDKIDSEKNKGPRGDKAVIEKLTAELKAAIEKANSYVEKEAYSKIIDQNGGVGMNASTSIDYTNYFYSLPANRVELWFLLTSQVFKEPIMREFYKERDVVREERRMRLESSVQGKMMETMLGLAFPAHPMHTIIGWASDIENLRAKDSTAFFRQYYVPSNMVMVLSGDIDPKEVKRLADQYFSGLKSGPTPPRVITQETAQYGERRGTVETENQPMVYIGYKRPETNHPDDAALSVLAGALSSGRTGVLYKKMVEEKRLALFTQAGANFPSDKYPGVFLLISVPSPGKTIEENEKAIYEILEDMKNKPLDAAVLQRQKTQLRASLIRGLDSNMGMAQNLAVNHVLRGSWRNLFTDLQDIDKVTAEDVQRVAKQYFVEAGRTVVTTKTAAKKESK